MLPGSSVDTPDITNSLKKEKKKIIENKWEFYSNFEIPITIIVHGSKGGDTNYIHE